MGVKWAPLSYLVRGLKNGLLRPCFYCGNMDVCVSVVSGIFQLHYECITIYASVSSRTQLKFILSALQVIPLRGDHPCSLSPRLLTWHAATYRSISPHAKPSPQIE